MGYSCQEKRKKKKEKRKKKKENIVQNIEYIIIAL
jgi:hypothetical protein